ncbi:NgoFVII family restriction endonuclease [Pseudomonas sp. SWRI50]|uniref:phospholipase D-like domain-containing protein n=1 Tax=Pseudomonas sp. SWRI50 TaxID=2745484 RepID=UPI001646563C|nr:phospholipase D-like domain-containing protein [Pseudomonas sp. SWRI50]MBC3487142.1 NgoFVII family restriction endonuclease [Pseudomonas sp. SWRI50]
MSKELKLLLNLEDSGHSDEIGGFLADAEHLECMVAFAKLSAKDTFLTPFKQAIARGMTARVAIGLSLFVTDPAMLNGLLGLQKKNKKSMQFYISNTDYTFHPKVYGVRGPKGCRVIVGSANLTAGGLCNNYEASVVASDPQGNLMASIQEHLDSLINDGTLVLATQAGIDHYAKLHAIHEAWRKMAKRRAGQISRGEIRSLDVLAVRLADMKADGSVDGFTAQRTQRARARRMARQRIKGIAELGKVSSGDFSDAYDSLLRCFHSGGLHRGKGIVSRNARRFVSALADVLRLKQATPGEAFELLHNHFVNIDRAGINVLTEILHALDNKRYAVMNQNAVSGMMVAGYNQYPLSTLKSNVSPGLYEEFCRDVKRVQTDLGLKNFSEIDALFNYVYWLAG